MSAMTTDELIERLLDTEVGSQVQATTPHGTYLFDVANVEDTPDGGAVLLLKAVK